MKKILFFAGLNILSAMASGMYGAEQDKGRQVLSLSQTSKSVINQLDLTDNVSLNRDLLFTNETDSSVFDTSIDTNSDFSQQIFEQMGKEHELDILKKDNNIKKLENLLLNQKLENLNLKRQLKKQVFCQDNSYKDERIRQLQAISGRLSGKNKQLMKENSQLKIAIEKFKEDGAKLKEKEKEKNIYVDKVNKLIEDSQLTIGNLEKTILRYSDKIKDMETLNQSKYSHFKQSIDKQKNELERKLKVYQEQENFYQTQINSCINEIEASKRTWENQQKKILEIENQFERQHNFYQTQISSYIDEIEDNKKILENQRKKISDLEAQLREKEELIAKNLEQEKIYRGQIDSHIKETESSKKAEEDQQKRISELEKQLKEKEELIAKNLEKIYRGQIDSHIKETESSEIKINKGLFDITYADINEDERRESQIFKREDVHKRKRSNSNDDLQALSQLKKRKNFSDLRDKFINTIKNGLFIELENLIKMYPGLVEIRDQYNNNVLHVAARHCRSHIFEKLLNLSSVDINERNESRETPLLIALKHYYRNKKDMAEATKDSKSHKDDKAQIIQFKNKNYLFIIKLLLDKYQIDVNVEDKNGLSPLFLAISNSDYNMCWDLIKVGGDIYSVDEGRLTDQSYREDYESIKINYQGFEALKGGYIEKAKEIITSNKTTKSFQMRKIINFIYNSTQYPEKINYQNSKGYTALMMACCLDLTKLAKKILELNPDVCKEDKYGNTALVYAARNKNFQLVDLLLKKSRSQRLHTNFLGKREKNE